MTRPDRAKLLISLACPFLLATLPANAASTVEQTSSGLRHTHRIVHHRHVAPVSIRQARLLSADDRLADLAYDSPLRAGLLPLASDNNTLPLVHDVAFRPLSTSGQIQIGTASWYGGRSWQGNRTSDGSRFDENALTAAHATLPLGSQVRVYLVGGERSVVVTITDRPGTRRRVIDLSRAAAAALGMLDRGVAQVALQPL